MHTVDPAVLTKVPARQLLQTEAAVLLYEPDEHVVQLAEPLDGAYVPEEHAEQTDTPD